MFISVFPRLSIWFYIGKIMGSMEEHLFWPNNPNNIPWYNGREINWLGYFFGQHEPALTMLGTLFYNSEKTFRNVIALSWLFEKNNDYTDIEQVCGTEKGLWWISSSISNQVSADCWLTSSCVSGCCANTREQISSIKTAASAQNKYELSGQSS